MRMSSAAAVQAVLRDTGRTVLANTRLVIARGGHGVLRGDARGRE